MIKLTNLRAIPSGMVTWVRSVEAAIRELQSNYATLRNATYRRNTTYQTTTPLQLMQGETVEGTLTAAESMMALQPVWSPVPCILITNQSTYDSNGNQVKSAMLTLGGNDVQIMPLGSISIGYLPMSGSAANLYRDPSTGMLSFTASSERYKQDITDADQDVLAGVLDNFRTVAFRMKDEVERLGDDAPYYFGGLAEEVAAIDGADRFVDYLEKDGKKLPEGIRYATLVVPLIAGYRKLKAQNEALEQRIAALEARLGDDDANN